MSPFQAIGISVTWGIRSCTFPSNIIWIRPLALTVELYQLCKNSFLSIQHLTEHQHLYGTVLVFASIFMNKP